MALSSAFEELEVLLKQHVKGSDSSEKRDSKEIKKTDSKDVKEVNEDQAAGIQINLEELNAALAEALVCGHPVQKITLPTAGQVLKISCNVCEKNFEVNSAMDDSLTLKENVAVEMKEMPKVLFTGYRSDWHVSILIKLGAEVTSSLDSATLVVTDSLRLTSNLVGAVCKGLPILSPAWVLASKDAKVLLPTDKFLLKDQYREQHWGVNLAATLAKARKGSGVLEGKQVVFSLNSTNQDEEEGSMDCYESLVRLGGGSVVKEAANISGEDMVVVVVDEDRKEMGEVVRLRKQGAKMVDKKTFLRSLLKQMF